MFQVVLVANIRFHKDHAGRIDGADDEEKHGQSLETSAERLGFAVRVLMVLHRTMQLPEVKSLDYWLHL